MSEPVSSALRAVTAPTCAFPGCERPPRPAAAGAGSKPKYCDLTDETGRGLHTAMTAFRARATLDRRAADDGPARSGQPARPVTMATVRASELRVALLADASALIDKLTMAAGQLQAAADPRAAEAQIEAAQAEADARVADGRRMLARESQRRQQAEAAAEQARAAALEMDEKLQAAEQACADAEARARSAEAEGGHAAAAAARYQLAAERAGQRAAVAEARAASAGAETARVREDAARGLDRLRADAEREREEMRAALESRARALEETGGELRTRAERAEHDLDAARAELDLMRAGRGHMVADNHGIPAAIT